MNKYYKQNRDVEYFQKDTPDYYSVNKDYLLNLIMKQLNLTNKDLYSRPSDLKNKIRNNKLNSILED